MNIQTKIGVLLCAVIVAIPTGIPSHVFAAESTTQQNVQKAVETVKEAITDLVTAKDEKKPAETPLRVDTLKKALTLATDEAKDLRLKLLTIDDLSEEYEAWKKDRIVISKEMIDTLDRFKKEITALEKSEEEIESGIKALGTRIKEWRETTYGPFANEIRDYLFIADEYKTIETAKTRAEKIEIDITKLEKKKKKTEELRKLLNKADLAILEAKKLNDEAEQLFRKNYFPKIESEIKTSSTTPVIEQQEQLDGEIVAQPKSIRDLVKDSSNKIRESYKIFIEMSNLVRKLLK